MAVRVPPPSVLEHVFPLVLVFLQRVGSAVGNTAGFSGLRASSWYRDPEDNRRVGGHPQSQHLFGLGLDVVGAQEVLERLAIEARGAGLTAIEERTHLHLQLFPAGVLGGLAGFGSVVA